MPVPKGIVINENTTHHPNEDHNGRRVMRFTPLGEEVMDQVGEFNFQAGEDYLLVLGRQIPLRYRDLTQIFYHHYLSSRDIFFSFIPLWDERYSQWLMQNLQELSFFRNRGQKPYFASTLVASFFCNTHPSIFSDSDTLDSFSLFVAQRSGNTWTVTDRATHRSWTYEPPAHLLPFLDWLGRD